jgi:FixJ family two-component response regulator
MCESCVTVCVVEDDPNVCESLDAVICSLGHSCRVFFNAEDLVAELDSLTWQCLIIDVDLPGMNGVELLKLLRGRNIDTPAVFYTARINDDVRLATERWSGVSVLEKGQGASPIQRYLENTLVD